MNLRFYSIKLLSCLSMATCLSLNAAEISQNQASSEEIRNSVMRVVFQEGCTPELLVPRLSFYAALLYNHNDKLGRVIAENAVGGTIALSPNGDYCAFTLRSDRNSIQVYDTHKGMLLPALTGHAHKVTCVAFSRDSQSLFSGDNNGDVYVWNCVSGKLIRKYTCPLPGDAVPRLRPVHCFSDDGRSCLIGGYLDSKCWNFDSGTLINAQDFGYDRAAIHGFAAFGQLVLHHGVGWDSCVYDVLNRREILSSRSGAMSYASASHLIAVCRYDFSHVEIYDTQTGNLLKTLPLNNRYETCRVCFGPEGNYLVVAVGHRGRLYVFDVKAGRLVQELNNGVYYSRLHKCYIAVDRCGQIAAFAGCENDGSDSKVRLFNSLPESVCQALRSLSLNQLLVLMEIVPSLARGHIIHLTPNSRAWELVSQMPPEIRTLVEPCLQPLSWSEYLRSFLPARR